MARAIIPRIDIPEGTVVTATEDMPRDEDDQRSPFSLRGPLHSRWVKGFAYWHYLVDGHPADPKTIEVADELEEAKREGGFVRDKIGRFASTTGSGGAGADAGGGGGGSENAGGAGGAASAGVGGQAGSGGADVSAQVHAGAGLRPSQGGADSRKAPSAKEAIEAGAPAGTDRATMRQLKSDGEVLTTVWNHDSSGDHSQLLMAVASQRTGIPAKGWVSSDPVKEYGIPDRTAAAHALLEGNAKRVREEFPDPNATVTVYRGGMKSHDPNSTSANLNVLSSWSTDIHEAAAFSSGAENSVISAKIPVSKIAGTSKSGLGNYLAHEVVVYGGSTAIRVVPNKEISQKKVDKNVQKFFKGTRIPGRTFA